MNVFIATFNALVVNLLLYACIYTSLITLMFCNLIKVNVVS